MVRCCAFWCVTRAPRLNSLRVQVRLLEGAGIGEKVRSVLLWDASWPMERVCMGCVPVLVGFCSVRGKNGGESGGESEWYFGGSSTTCVQYLYVNKICRQQEGINFRLHSQAPYKTFRHVSRRKSGAS